MPLGVLITQCLQHDFVAPLGAHDPVPNPLHVGHAEARRLVGEDPKEGPLAAFLRWAHAQPPEKLQLIHVRDWHDPADPKQQAHLARFGPHCLRETPGAAFVPGIEAARPNAHVVDAVELNDYEETRLAQVLDSLRVKSPDGALRVGVVGVWTDAKVSFLLYDLRTRGQVSELGTCSAFTASFSRAQHANALDQLHRLLDVRVDHSPGDFAAWLTGAPAELPTRKLGRAAMVQVAFTRDPPESLRDPDGADRTLLAYLFRSCRSVTLRPLSGGFSGCAVLLAESVDGLGQKQAPSVVKIGPRKDVGFERSAFESIEGVLGNAAPSIIDFADDGERGAIRYRYAAMGKGDVQSLQKLYAGGADAEVARVLREALGEVLGPLYAAATEEPLDLLADYEFSSRWAPGVARNVAELTGDASGGERVRIPGWGEAPHLARFYDRDLDRLPRVPGARHPVAMTHGDLNGQNVLVDGRGNVWVIDFGRVRRGHALRDFAKLENDLLYIMTAAGDDLSQARALSELLAAHELGEPLPPLPTMTTDPALRRVHASVDIVRQLAARVARTGYRVALLRFAAHTLGFTEPTLAQRRWALGAASLLAERIAAGQT